MAGDSRVERYLAEVARRVAGATGDLFVGAYAGGSWALGAYVPGRSDLDVAAVVSSALPAERKEAIVALVRHETLPCPARGLELVVYTRAAAGSPSAEPRFELNLNTGPRMPFRVETEPAGPDGHWYAIDRAVLRDHGVALAGPAAPEVFAAIPRDALLPVVAASLRWHLGDDADIADAVLNACRALRYASEGVWTSKAAAGEWALARGGGDAAVVEAALRAHAGSGAPPDRARGRSFVRAALGALPER